MKHHILAKFLPEITPEDKTRMIPEIRTLFENTTAIEGIGGVSVYPNCVDRENRYDLMVVIEMDREALPAYDGCVWHKEWKNKYGPLLAGKAIFDCE